jgi:trypsin
LIDPDRYPYFALMNGQNLCGAVLIAKRFVLTAAHCVGADDDFEIGITEIDSSLAILFSDSDSGGTEYPYGRKVVHPRYNDVTLDNDIALYELTRDVPGALPYIRLGQAPVTEEGLPLTVIGFGVTDTNSWSFLNTPSDYLLRTTVDYVSQSSCIDQMREKGPSFGGGNAIGANMLCAFSPGEDSCQGDSGGPIFLGGDSAEEDVLVGLVSWGYDCGGDTPGVYTRISYFYDWIVETMCALNPSGVPDYVDCNNTDNDNNDNDNNDNDSNNTGGGTGTTSSGSGNGSGSGTIEPTEPTEMTSFTQSPTGFDNDGDDVFFGNDNVVFWDDYNSNDGFFIDDNVFWDDDADIFGIGSDDDFFGFGSTDDYFAGDNDDSFVAAAWEAIKGWVNSVFGS